MSRSDSKLVLALVIRYACHCGNFPIEYCLGIYRTSVIEQAAKVHREYSEFLKAFGDGFKTFVSTWQSNSDFRASAVVIIRKLLQSLAFTGPAAKGDLVRWWKTEWPPNYQVLSS